MTLTAVKVSSTSIQELCDQTTLDVFVWCHAQGQDDNSVDPNPLPTPTPPAYNNERRLLDAAAEQYSFPPPPSFSTDSFPTDPT